MRKSNQINNNVDLKTIKSVYSVSEPQNDAIARKNDSLYLYVSVLTAYILLFDCGCNFTWTSPAAFTLRSFDLNINPLGRPVTPVEESWIAALVNLGAALGPLTLGKLSDVFGRRKMLLMITVLKIAGYIILAFAQNIYVFYTARFLLGVGMGLTFAVTPMYIGEVFDNHNRGIFGTIMSIYIMIGMIYTLVIGPLLPLQIFTLSCIAFLIILLISFPWLIPESPMFLVSVQKQSEAKTVLTKIKTWDSQSVEKNLALLTEIVEEANARRNNFIDILKTKSSRTGLLICMAICALQHLSGYFPIIAFIGPIFEATGSQIPSNISVILVTVIQLISTCLSSFAIERLGRRPLLLLSTVATCLSLLALGSYFYFKEMGTGYISSIFWLPVTSLMVYISTVSMGINSVSMVIQSEVFSSNIRAVAASFITFFGAIVAFTVTFIFPVLVVLIGQAMCFWVFAVFMALGTIFIYFFIPETKGKSIVEIQKILS